MALYFTNPVFCIFLINIPAFLTSSLLLYGSGY